MRVWKLPRVRERHEGALPQIQRDNCLCAVRSDDRGVAAFSAAALENKLAREILSSERSHPVEKFLFVVVAEIAPARPFLGKARGRFELDAGEVGREKNWNAIANRELRSAGPAGELSGHEVAIFGGRRSFAAQRQVARAIGTHDKIQGFWSHLDGENP